MTALSDGRVIIVTGASRGLGKEIALRFGSSGQRVVVHYREREQAANVVANCIRASGGDAVAFRADVRSASEVDAMIEDTVKRWGGIDVLVNNAGMTKDGLLQIMAEQQWDDVVDTNLTGPFHCIRAVSETMMKQQRGHIISIASIVGLQGREGQANYSSSKAGLIGLTKACAKELGRFDIKVNAILPGFIHTGMGLELSQKMIARIVGSNALGRTSSASEVADFVYHLSLMQNVSGQVFNLDSRVL